MQYKDFSQQIRNWKERGIIDATQAATMLSEVEEERKESSANKMITSLSTIGAVLVGLGAILFVASNWMNMGNGMKLFVLIGSTLASLGTGYVLKYDRQNYPQVGASLLFLGALLFGASTFLIAQMYHVNAHNHALLLIWLLGIAPLAYGLHSKPTAFLSLVIFFVWISFFHFRGSRFFGDILFFLPPIYVLAGLLVIGLGSLHYMKKEYIDFGRMWQIAGMKVSMFSLFLLTFNSWHAQGGISNSKYSWIAKALETANVQTTFIVLLIATLLSLVAVIALNPSNRRYNSIEHIVALIPTVFIFTYLYGNIDMMVLFNILFVGLTLFILIFGYQKENMAFVNTGILWTSVYIFAKYVDWFWELMPRSLFFITAGAILVFGGIWIERKRREIRNQFSTLHHEIAS